MCAGGGIVGKRLPISAWYVSRYLFLIHILSDVYVCVGGVRQFAGCRPALPKQHRDDVSAVEGMKVSV